MKLLIVVILSCFVQVISAQSIFKPLPKVAKTDDGGFLQPHAVLQPDSTINAFRAIANLAAYAEPGNVLMAGAGISYEHLKWDYSAAKWKSVWSVSAVGWAGGSLSPKTPADAIAYGIMVGFFNNLIMVGPAYNAGLQGSKIQGVISLGINLNN